MGGAFKIGRVSGIDVRVHWTFFLLLAFFAFIGYQASGSPVGALTAGAGIAPEVYPGAPSVCDGGVGSNRSQPTPSKYSSGHECRSQEL